MDAHITEAMARVRLEVAEPGGLRMTVDLVGQPAAGSATGLARTTMVEGRDPVVQVQRSPDRSRLAVLVDSELFNIDLTALSTSDVVPVALDPAPDGESVVVWNADGPGVVSLGDDGPHRLRLDDGRFLVLDAPAFIDDGFSGGDHGSGSMYRLPADMDSPEGVAVRAAVQEHLQRRAATRRPAVCCIEGDHTTAVLLDQLVLPPADVQSVHWPVTVGVSGIVVRTSRTRIADDGSDDTHILEPWFVAPDGAVRRIPERLGNAPLCELPDGRWLLFGADPLWGDAGNEPLHVFGLDGSVTPWTPAGAAVTTTSLLTDVGSDLLPAAPPENPDDWPWARAARVSSDEKHLMMLITDVMWTSEWDRTGDVGWAVVRVRLSGTAPPTLIASGLRNADHFETVAL